ncbi:MAG: SDR family oxidoreductase [Saprospiraceae bacterium]|nr:SDR family oxidoreductase [Saprospiraceae bacterium]
MNKVLIAGATGYLGKFLTKEVKKQGYETKVLVRNPAKFKEFNIEVDEIIQAEITVKKTLHESCNNIDVVISSVGITRQRDGLTYMDVDYQANMNLLEEAIKAGVKKFIYVSVLNGEELKHLKICEAKEKFAEKLKKSGIDYSIIRPNAFFADMAEFYNMAKNGRFYIFGNGKLKCNPIHGEDLAKVCVDAIKTDDNLIKVGGPQTLTQTEIAQIAFKTVNKKVKITHIPDWIRRMMLGLCRIFLSSKSYGPIEFFMTVLSIDMIAPEYGAHTLEDFFETLE